jgi:prolycopene isomerase
MPDSRPDPRHESYDVVVIGAGLGGLAAAAFTARAGKRVLVVERQDRVGGLAHSFERGQYHFDTAVHATSFGSVEPSLHTMLDELGVGDRCEWLQCATPLYSTFFGDDRVDLPMGVGAFTASLQDRFPAEADGIARFVDLLVTLTREMERPRPQGSTKDMTAAADTFSTILQYRHATVADALDEHLSDPRLKAVIAANWPNVGLPPSELSLLYWTGMATIRMEGGQYYCAGGFQGLGEAFAEAVRMHGGEIVLGAEATGISVEDGRATGVTLSGDRHVRAGAVVSNGDLIRTFESLVGVEHLPTRTVRKLGRMKPSLSAFIVFAVTRLDLKALGFGHVAFAYPSWDHEASFAGSLAGEPTSLMIAMPSVTDSSLTPPGEHVLSATALVRYDARDWSADKERCTEAVLDRLERIMPGFRDALVFTESATPQTIERFSAHHNGAMYGWANSVDQVATRRPSNKTPIEGLFLAGHWAQPGSGSMGVIFSGLRASQLALGRHAEHLGAAV